MQINHVRNTENIQKWIPWSTLPTTILFLSLPCSFSSYYLLQFSSATQSCPTLSNLMDCSTPGLPVHHQLTEFVQTHLHWMGDAIQPSHPLSSPSPPALNLSQHQGLFQWVGASHEVVTVLELQHQTFQWILLPYFLLMKDRTPIQEASNSSLSWPSLPFAATWINLELVILGEGKERKTNAIWYRLYVEH